MRVIDSRLKETRAARENDLKSGGDKDKREGGAERARGEVAQGIYGDND